MAREVISNPIIWTFYVFGIEINAVFHEDEHHRSEQAHDVIIFAGAFINNFYYGLIVTVEAYGNISHLFEK